MPVRVRVTVMGLPVTGVNVSVNVCVRVRLELLETQRIEFQDSPLTTCGKWTWVAVNAEFEPFMTIQEGPAGMSDATVVAAMRWLALTRREYAFVRFADGKIAATLLFKAPLAGMIRIIEGTSRTPLAP
jgi:hypothetical protein